MSVHVKTMAILMLLLTSALLSAEKTGVSWTDGVIRTRGTDRISVSETGTPIDPDTGREISISEARRISYKRSREMAVMEAAAVIPEITVNGGETIRDLISENQTAMTRLTRVVYEYSKFNDVSSGYMETACELCIKTGYIITALDYGFPCEEFPLSDYKASATEYTSLIVDTRGLGIGPMLLPSIYNEDGLEIYGRNFISGDDAVKHLAVSYAHSEKDALKHKKAGKHPFFCVALKNLNGSPVLADEDIRRVFSHKKNLAYMKKCRVIFIIDR